MKEQDRRILRPWRIVAAEAAKETDPQRMIEFISELSQALDEQEGVFRKNMNRSSS